MWHRQQTAAVRNFFQQTWHSQVKGTWLGTKIAAKHAVVVEKNVRRQVQTDGLTAL